jgi:hypothetical protein
MPVRVFVLQWRYCLLVTLIPLLFLFPLFDMRDLTPSEVLILGLWVIFSREVDMFPMDILSIGFSIVFIIMLNFSSEDHDVDGYASPWGLLSLRLNLKFIFPDAIMFTSTSKALLIIASRLVDLVSLNNWEKSLSKESAYRNCAAPGGGLNSIEIQLYTFKKWIENSCIVPFISFLILLYCVSSCKGFFLPPHLFRKDISNAVKSRILVDERDLNHFLTSPKRLCENSLIFTFVYSTSSRSTKSLNQFRCLWAETFPSTS